jgi:hypothetical protein
MVTDKRYGLSVNLIATKVLPLLTPQLVNPQLQYEHFVVVHEVLQEMYDAIDRLVQGVYRGRTIKLVGWGPIKNFFNNR